MFELRDAIRGLRRDRGFAVAAILTLGVTIGATTAAFSIVDGVLLKPLAFPEPDRLVTLHENWREVMKPGQTFPVNEQHFEHWRAHNTAFESMAQYITLPANLTSGGPASQIPVVRSSGSLFDVLGATPLLGRALRAEDEPDGAADVVMSAKDSGGVASAPVPTSSARRSCSTASHLKSSAFFLQRSACHPVINCSRTSRPRSLCASRRDGSAITTISRSAA